MLDIKKSYNNIEEVYAETVEKFLTISDANLDDRLMKHAALHGFFGSLLAYAKRVVEKEELALSILATKHKTELNAKSGKKPSLHVTETYVDAKEDIISKKKDIIEAEFKYNLVKGIVFSLGNQKDMLVQLSSNRRHEQKLLTD